MCRAARLPAAYLHLACEFRPIEEYFDHSPIHDRIFAVRLCPEVFSWVERLATDCARLLSQWV
jgi:hypothetical protein